ncbi:unnamed protein product, partial [Closterium sp. NIES-54]
AAAATYAAAAELLMQPALLLPCRAALTAAAGAIAATATTAATAAVTALACGGGYSFMGTGQRRQQRQQETFSPQRLRECVSQRGVPSCLEAAALGASESGAALDASESAATLSASASTANCPASAEALHTFTLDSGTSRCYFCDCTIVTPLAASVPVSLADPSWGPVVARASTVLLCPNVRGVLIPWIRATRRQLREWFRWDVLVLRLHSDRGGELSSGLLAEFCQDEGTAPPACVPPGPPDASLPGDTGAGGTGAIGDGGTGNVGAAGTGGFGGAADARGAGAGGTGGAGVASPGGACIRGAGAVRASGAASIGGAGGAGGTAGVGGTGAGGTRGAGGAGAGGAGAAGARGAGAADGTGTAQHRPFFYPHLQSSRPSPDSVLRQVLSLQSSTGLTPPLMCLPTDLSQPQLLPGSPLPALAPDTEVTESLTERREPETRASTPVRARRVTRPRPPAIRGPHVMALRPSSVPQRLTLPSPPASSLPDVLDPESDLTRAAGPTVTRLLATVVTDPEFESTAAFALVTELVDFATRRRLDYVTSLVTESESIGPLSIGGEPTLPLMSLRTSSLGLSVSWPLYLVSHPCCPEGDPDELDIPTPRPYAKAIAGTYVDEVPPPGANIVDGMWIFRVKRPPSSPPAFKARYVARGFSQRHGVDYFQTFSTTPKMTTLQVLLHVAAQRDYELLSLDFSTAYLQGQPSRGDLAAPPTWLHWVISCGTTLMALGFAPSSADPSLFLCTDTTMPPFYVLVYVDDLVFATVDTEALALVKADLQERHTCTDLAPPSDESIEPSGLYPELVGCLICEAEIYAGAMAAQELRWLTYLLTDLGERPRSPLVLYVDNKAMIALCREQRLEHRTKHIALRHFLAQELQQRG